MKLLVAPALHHRGSTDLYRMWPFFTPEAENALNPHSPAMKTGVASHSSERARDCGTMRILFAARACFAVLLHAVRRGSAYNDKGTERKSVRARMFEGACMSSSARALGERGQRKQQCTTNPATSAARTSVRLPRSSRRKNAGAARPLSVRHTTLAHGERAAPSPTRCRILAARAN